MRIDIPEICLVALVGSTGSGKSAFASKHFKPTEVLSSDFFRGLVSDDENNQSVTRAAFDCLYYVAGKRLDAGLLAVVDATNVQPAARAKVIELAKEQNCCAAAIVFDLPPELCLERNNRRQGRSYPAQVIANHARELKRSLKSLKKEGFRHIYVLKTPEEADNAVIVRSRLRNDRRDESGPFDVIGDIHGCYAELCALLEKMGYSVYREAHTATPPEDPAGKRRLVFLGDLCDRGPENVQTLKLVMNMVTSGAALCTAGNHDVKLLRKLQGANVQVSYGLDVTLAQLENEPDEFIAEAKNFLQGLISHYVLDEGKLVVSHAGLKEKLQGRSSAAVRRFCLYGETTGETDEFGLPIRLDWADEYRGKALVLYGHTPCLAAQPVNNTLCLDTGCVFGGKLTAYRYPEKKLVEVPALRQYYAPVKPLDYRR
ncbi:MAG: AAA family ATPase [Deltaproteobacteria bacterium]|jgi:protein phosphatase|nr:AAA family ATPase [Deltaproteobacteria bacterium]